MFFTTNTFMATGGITTPIITVMAMSMPNHSGSTQFHHGGEEDRRGQDHEGQVIEEGSAQQVDEGDEHHDEVLVQGEGSLLEQCGPALCRSPANRSPPC
jgi:hypothetical protein